MKPFFAATVVALLLIAVAPTFAQQRAQVDVTSVSVHRGQKLTIRKSLYWRNNGRMVIDQTAPEHFVYLTNTLGEMKAYNPATNQVMVASDKEFSSTKEMFTMFASGSYLDMGLPYYGYTQSSVETVDGRVVKTFSSNQAAAKGISRIELVFERHTPIYMAYYMAKGEVVRKVYFSRYVSDRVLMPTRITDIEYAKGDSTVTLSLYDNFRFDHEADSPMFDFTIPDDAEAVPFTMPQ